MAKAWLIGVATLVLALVIAGVAIALVNERGDKLLPADSPEGVVQRYLRAVDNEEFREAYGYLGSDLQARCSYDRFLQGTPRPPDIADAQITLERIRLVDDDRAQVRVKITRFNGGGPFGGEYSYDETVYLKLEDGQWRLAELTWPFGWCPPPYPRAPLPPYPAY